MRAPGAHREHLGSSAEEKHFLSVNVAEQHLAVTDLAFSHTVPGEVRPFGFSLLITHAVNLLVGSACSTGLL
jgi:hypothetical protein